MRVGFDARLLIYRRGMGNYVFNLIRELAQVRGGIEIIAYIDDPSGATVLPSCPAVHYRLLRPALYPLWEQVMLPLAASRDAIDVLHCPANTGPIMLGSSVSLVLTIHDAMYLLPSTLLPRAASSYQQAGRIYRRVIVPRAAQRAERILTDSEQSRRDILRYLKPASPVTVVPLAPSPEFKRIPDDVAMLRIRTSFGIRPPFVLALGAADPRKNTRRVVEAFALAKQQHKLSHRLVVVGLSASLVRTYGSYANKLGIESEVDFLGFVDEEDLVALYNQAEALIYPSLYEGFGLPVLEALACGTPVLTSGDGAIAEVAGGAALLVDPQDSRSIAEGLTRLICDDALRERLRRAGAARVDQFSWARAAEATRDVYRSLGG